MALNNHRFTWTNGREDLNHDLSLNENFIEKVNPSRLDAESRLSSNMFLVGDEGITKPGTFSAH